MAEQVKRWWWERAKEPSTYQGLSILFGIIGTHVFGAAALGVNLLDIGLALASVIQVGKAEALPGRDF